MKYITQIFIPWAMAVFISMILVTLPCNAVQSLDDETAKIVSGIEAKYANKSFSADFEQASHLTARITSYNVCYTKLLRPKHDVLPEETQIAQTIPDTEG